MPVSPVMSSISMRAALTAFLILCTFPAASQASTWRAPGPDEKRHAVTLFAGQGTESNFSDILEKFFDVDSTGDRVAAIALSRHLGWYGEALSFEAEAMYAWHYGRETYHEIGTALYARWHHFPWNKYMLTTVAAGLGPSYTTEFPQLERQPDGSRSRLLNQFNLQTTLALPRYPDVALVARMQHRSGMFGLFNGVTDASNFLTLGLRYDF